MTWAPPRSAATIKTTAPALLWALDRVAFRHILMQNTRKTIMDNVRFLKKCAPPASLPPPARRPSHARLCVSVPLLKPLSDEQVGKLAEALQRVTFADGEYIIRQGAATAGLRVRPRRLAHTPAQARPAVYSTCCRRAAAAAPRCRPTAWSRR